MNNPKLPKPKSVDCGTPPKGVQAEKKGSFKMLDDLTDDVFDQLMAFNVLLPARDSLGEIYLLSSEGEPLFEEPYALVDFYCLNPDCDCCKVTLVIQDKKNRPIATIAYGWQSVSYYQQWGLDKTTASLLSEGFLDPMGPQSKKSDMFLEIVQEMVEINPHFKKWLQNRYHLFKKTVPQYGKTKLLELLRGSKT